MRIKNTVRIVALACVAGILAALMTSCIPSGQQQVDAAQQNREYMSNVNRISNEAAEDLATFSQAASQGDLAAMRIAASEASETLGKISDLTAPDALKEVHEEYKAGVADLGKALSEYIELYAAASNGTKGETGDGAQDSGALDSSALDQAAIDAVQETYQSGIDHLSKADSMVAQISGGQSDDSQGQVQDGQQSQGDAQQG